MIAKLRRIAIYDIGNDKVVTLTTIQDGVEGAGGFFYEEEEDTLTIDDDQTYLLSFLCRLEARVLGQSSVRADLMAMVGEECIISGVGIDGFVQFGRCLPPTSNANTFADTVKIVAVDQVDKSTVFRIVAQRRSTKAYVSGVLAGGVGAFNSMLNVYDVTSGITGLMYGFYGATTLATYSLTNTASGYAFQNVIAGGSSADIFSARFLFPFNGIPVTLSFRNEVNEAQGFAKVTTFTGTTTTTFQAETTVSLGVLVGTRVTATITPTATTTFVGCSLGLTSGGAVGFSLPALRVNSLTAFEKF